MEHILAILQRTLSGVRQYFGYSKSQKGMWFTSIFIWLVDIFQLIRRWKKLKHPLLATLFCLISIVSSFMVIFSFNSKQRTKLIGDVHLWVFAETGSFTFQQIFSGANWLDLLFALFPAMTLFQGFVNISNGLRFIERKERTDDPSGKTTGIPFLKLKIPRIRNGKLKLILGLGSIVLYILNKEIFHFNLNFDTILNFLNFKNNEKFA